MPLDGVSELIVFGRKMRMEGNVGNAEERVAEETHPRDRSPEVECCGVSTECAGLPDRGNQALRLCTGLRRDRLWAAPHPVASGVHPVRCDPCASGARQRRVRQSSGETGRVTRARRVARKGSKHRKTSTARQAEEVASPKEAGACPFRSSALAV